MNRSITLPGIVWVALLVGLPMFAQWLEQYFGDLPWALPLAGLVLIVAKIAQVYRADEAPMGGERAMYEMAPPVEQDKLTRALWG